MTAPATLYQQEKARRGIELPRATGCPRKPLSFVVTAPRPERVVRKQRADRSRWDEWATLYRDGLTLTEIGRQFNVRHQTVQYALRKMNVKRRPRGDGHTHDRLLRQIETLRRDKALLLARLQGLRRKYREDAA